MTPYVTRYPNLRYFFACYFHQDWDDDGSFEKVVHLFLAENRVDTIIPTIRELEDFLGLELSEKELEKIVTDDLAANVYAPGLGLHVPAMAGSGPGHPQNVVRRVTQTDHPLGDPGLSSRRAR